MKLKTLLFTLGSVLLAGLMLTYTLIEFPESSRYPNAVKDKYESLKACEKQEILWQKILASTYKTNPDFNNFSFVDLLSLARQQISLKAQNQSDFAPEGWRKLLHARGSVAKVKLVPLNNKYTGIFQGADCALLRLSLTFKPTGNRPVAPGLAFKVLRDGVNSANISALVSLDGQGEQFNFFRYPLSNIVPIGKEAGQKIVHRIFRKVSGFPEELMAKDMASIDAQGVTPKEVVAPRQIFFVPSSDFNFSFSEHDVRDDFEKIPEGTVLYQVFLAPEKYNGFDYTNYLSDNVSAFLKESDHVANLVTTSKFVTSEFGDSGIFFRHHVRP